MDEKTSLVNRAEKVNFVVEKFYVKDTITHLNKMMKEVTAKDMAAHNVNAACNCVARLNETIDTAIRAAKFLS